MKSCVNGMLLLGPFINNSVNLFNKTKELQSVPIQIKKTYEQSDLSGKSDPLFRIKSEEIHMRRKCFLFLFTLGFFYSCSDLSNYKYIEPPAAVVLPGGPVPGNSGQINYTSATVSSLTINWAKATDDSTPQSNLQYQVFYSTVNNINTTSNVLVNGTPVDSFAPDISSKTILGLSSYTSYYLNLLVIDGDHNTNCYTMANFSTISTNAPVPGNSGFISKTSADTNALTISWAPASDDVTPPASLQYLVYYSSANNINTVSEVLSNGTPLGVYTPGISTKLITGLAPSTYYYFNVLVKDSDNFTNSYTATNFSTLTNSAPVPGGLGTIMLGSAAPSSITINWATAYDDFTLQNNLIYEVYYSFNNNITDVASTLTHGTLIGSNLNISNMTLSPLPPATTCYFSVLVIDADNLISNYTSAAFSTTENPPSAASGLIGCGTVSNTSIVLNWNKAGDDVSPSNALQYLVIYSTNNNIANVTTATDNGTPFGGYTADINTKTVTNLIPSTTYYFNVLVKDTNGYIGNYTSTNFTLSNLPPVPGVPSSITIGAVQTTAVDISWIKASDDLTLQNNLMYGVYYSSSSNFSTVAEVLANGTLSGIYTANINNKTVGGLTIDTSYFFNVLVADASGYTNVYQAASQKTLCDMNSYTADFYFDNLTNIVGNGYYLANSGTTLTNNRDGTPNSAISCNGGWLKTTNSSELIFTNELTISLWISSSNVTANQKIIGKFDAGANKKGYLIGIQNSHLYCELADTTFSNYVVTNGTNTLMPNTWMHIALTWKTGGKIKTYVNGIPDSSVNASLNNLGITSNYFTIGCEPWGSTLKFQGLVDDIRIYGRELDQAEVQYLCNLPAD